MLKKGKLISTLKGMLCVIVALLIFAEYPVGVFAADEKSDLSEVEENADPSGILGDLDDLEEEPTSPCDNFVNITEDAFDVTDFGSVDDEDKQLVFSAFSRDLRGIFSSIFKCKNLSELRKVVEDCIFIRCLDPRLRPYVDRFGISSDCFCMDQADFRLWYDKVLQITTKDGCFLKESDSDRFLDFRVLFLRESFLRSIYVSLSPNFDSDDLTKQRVYMINRNLLTFAGNNSEIISTDEVKAVYGQVGRLLSRDGSRKCFANCFLNLVDSKKYKKTWKICAEPGTRGAEMDFSVMSDFVSAKSILVCAYDKLKEAYRFLETKQYGKAYLCVGESRGMMERFRSSYRSIIPYSTSSSICEYEAVLARWNKIKNTIDMQIFICKRFEAYMKSMNFFINSFFLSSESAGIDIFTDLGNEINMIKCKEDSDEVEIGAITKLLNEAIGLKDGMKVNYGEVLLSCPCIQRIMAILDICIENISNLKLKIEVQVNANITKSERAKRREELKKLRIERQEFLRCKREQDTVSELLDVARRAAERRAESGCDDTEQEGQYQITYINDEIRDESIRFLRSDKKLESLWKKWFNDVQITGSSTMNFLPNMKSQREVFLRVKRGLIKLAPNGVIYEARLDTSGEKNGMRIVYYIEKDTNKVVILYVGEPFGVVHKNLVSVMVDYANFPEASLEDCEGGKDDSKTSAFGACSPKVSEAADKSVSVSGDKGRSGLGDFAGSSSSEANKKHKEYKHKTGKRPKTAKQKKR